VIGRDDFHINAVGVTPDPELVKMVLCIIDFLELAGVS
jgi:hypothetical protein